ncbi:PEP-CTERM sorting domain-containing protein [Calothrix sp. UHCC 0171]|uniref:PEP-CTERM sorting domain-containing protein n=1 Tax=Calothrix sp. UHCC 0171 TaxID=3110245 RepID=UPI002B1FC893|nr:PEP-CTERM sorting domain-containing protein [Calothrix sp. UHCC 0171]MEA5574399.1 PEP-CTERM sorting domain-containing protein [Calothrix sp. UHCC 0171]
MAQQNTFSFRFQRTVKIGVILVTGLTLNLFSSHSLYAATVIKDAVLGKNLIVNGNGEQGGCDAVGNAVGSSIPSIPAWKTTGSFSVLCYGASGFEFVNNLGQTVSVSGLPNANSPGPDNRGKNLFFGGADRSSSSASQLINVTDLTSIIDTGKGAYDLAAWLGGYATDQDNVLLSLDFLNQDGLSLGKTSITSPTPEERNNTTGLLFKSTQGILPVGSRQVNVVLNMNYVRGRVNDAYADKLSFVVTQVPEPSTTSGFVVAGAMLVMLKLRQKRRLVGVEFSEVSNAPQRAYKG